MGQALAEAFPEARAVFDAADEALHEPLSKLCFEGPADALQKTANTQPAILTVSAAAHAVLSARLPEKPALVAGHSLGEYSALVAAGALSLADGVRLVRARGTFMQEAVPVGVGAMAAVLGLPAEQVAEICREVAQGEVLSAANFNEPAQTVSAGHAAAVERAGERLKAAGAKRVVPLDVSAPFHCSLMAPVVPRLKAVLDPIEVLAPASPVVTNVEASPTSEPGQIRSLLLTQVTSSVRWVECVRAMEAHGIKTVIELGPGKVLSGLVRRITKSIQCLNVENPASLEKTLAALGGAARG